MKHNNSLLINKGESSPQPSYNNRRFPLYIYNYYYNGGYFKKWK